jgi:predicted phage gp36 major capsid-like protein
MTEQEILLAIAVADEAIEQSNEQVRHFANIRDESKAKRSQLEKELFDKLSATGQTHFIIEDQIVILEGKTIRIVNDAMVIE